MDWSRFRNPVYNFVNLGSLYSQTQQIWSRSGELRPPPVGRLYAGLNLGNLYRPTNLNEYDEPLGWAYFEDGSVFFQHHPYNHHDLQQVMRIASCFVRNPSDGKLALKRKDGQTQMTLVERSMLSPVWSPRHLHLYARYSNTGDNIVAPPTRYKKVTLELDPTCTSPISTLFFDRRLDRKRSAERFFLGLRTGLNESLPFRGTLINGVLQPNVRLGNGLQFSVDYSGHETEPQQNQQPRETSTIAEGIPRRTRGERSSVIGSKPAAELTSAKIPHESKQRHETPSFQRHATIHLESKASQLEGQEKQQSEHFREQQTINLPPDLAQALSRFVQQQGESFQERKADQLQKQLNKTALHLEEKVWKLEQKLAEASRSVQQQGESFWERKAGQLQKQLNKTTRHLEEKVQKLEQKLAEARKRDAKERNDKEREAQAQDDEIHDFLKENDTMPTTALKLLRAANQKR